jgi:hypothetical protein
MTNWVGFEIVEHTCIKKTIILKATDILAVQMLKLIENLY